VRANQISEARWQQQVVDVALRYQWRVYAIPDSRRVTMRGWPDLVLMKVDRVIYSELKTLRGRLRPDQKITLTILHAAGHETALWRPGMLPEIIQVLGPHQKRATPPDELTTTR
jgi:hypothetical protein